jgi:hypothetical protein
MDTTRPTISAPPDKPKPDIAYMSELWRTGQVANGVAKSVFEREAQCTRKIGEIGARGGVIRARCSVHTGHTEIGRIHRHPWVRQAPIPCLSGSPSSSDAGSAHEPCAAAPRLHIAPQAPARS